MGAPTSRPVFENEHISEFSEKHAGTSIRFITIGVSDISEEFRRVISFAFETENTLGGKAQRRGRNQVPN
jgi:hypothetical protein